MTYVQEINTLNSYNCTTFDDGCPDMFYHSDGTYKCKFSLLTPLTIQNIYLYILLNKI